jgi:PhzF family phenazine biosynthesis protein
LLTSRIQKDKIDLMETYIVDSFTNEAFKGNPAGVCILDRTISEGNMLSIAKELNLSETAYIKITDKRDTYTIRYFSPKMEIPLCGHATLAAAKVIFTKGDLNEIHFITQQGLDLIVRKSNDDIIMEFPIYDVESAEAPQKMLNALGIKKIANCVYNKENNILMLEIESASVLSGLSPDFYSLLDSHNSINGVLVTAPSGNDIFDFHSRYFWPWSGTNEDPVTGATHTFLAKYWGEKLHKNKMRSFQSSERTGYMEVELMDNNKLLIKSRAVIVLEGKIEG